MKRWWASVIKDYFTFTKRERTAVVLLVTIGIFIYFIPTLFAVKKHKLPDTAFANEIASLKISIDSNRGYRNYTNEDEAGRLHYEPKKDTYERTEKGELFVFDPNTLDNKGWSRLGLRDKTIETISNFRAKGYKFRQPEDIRKIYGLRSNEAERLIPYIRIAALPSGAPPVAAAIAVPHREVAGALPASVDINKADTSAFIHLRGIGSKLANRIVNFREKLGGFVSVDQLGETYGLSDSTFQKIKPLLRCSTIAPATININAADATILKSHPYIKWNVANAIVNYRQQHGNFKSIDELKKIDIIPEDLYRKIAPYLTAD